MVNNNIFNEYSETSKKLIALQEQRIKKVKKELAELKSKNNFSYLSILKF